MNTPDDDVDLILRRAGSDWRAAQPPALPLDLDRIRTGRRRPRRWMPLLAAASVAAIAAAGIVAIPNRSQPDLAANPPAVVDQIRAQLLVRNGDQVRVAGEVIAAPGRPVIVCVSAGSPRPIGEPPTCPDYASLTVTGVDLDRLSGQTTTRGVRSGFGTLTGVWTDRHVAVREQGVQPTGPWPLPQLPQHRPFAPDDVERANAAMRDYVRRHGLDGKSFDGAWMLVTVDRRGGFRLPVIDEPTLVELRRIGLNYFVWNPAVRPIR
jgi:hypothetical protein